MRRNFYTANDDKGGAGNEPKTPETLDEALKVIAEARADAERYKKSLDKQMSANKQLTEQLRERMTDAEKAAAADAEKETRLKELEKELGTIKSAKAYMALGMDEELAAKAAAAEVSGDAEGLRGYIATWKDSVIKAEQETFLKSRPGVNAGHETDGADAEDEAIKSAIRGY